MDDVRKPSKSPHFERELFLPFFFFVPSHFLKNRTHFCLYREKKRLARETFVILHRLHRHFLQERSTVEQHKSCPLEKERKRPYFFVVAVGRVLSILSDIMWGAKSSYQKVARTVLLQQQRNRSMANGASLVFAGATAAATVAATTSTTNVTDRSATTSATSQNLSISTLSSTSFSRTNLSHCDAGTTPGTTAQIPQHHPVRILRKQTTLKEAVFDVKHQATSPRRYQTKEELEKIRISEEAMLKRWERDEDGWRKLPARAWPEYQPNPEQLKQIQDEVAKLQCTSKNDDDNVRCTGLLFNIATSLVFYNIDARAGLELFQQLANKGHVDSMVACGIVLVEGMGVPPQEEEGIEWLKRAVKFESPQAYYELGTVLYTGIDGVVDENAEAAFEYFQAAAEHDHTAAMYMMADCLVEGDGTEKNIGRAVPLFYRAAEKGHRYARQRIRELLSVEEYKL